MSVTFANLPKESRLHEYIKAGDFMDCVHGAKVFPHMSAEKAVRIGILQMPAWVNKLMWLRNAIVRPFGIDTGKTPSFGKKNPSQLNMGDKIGVFNVILLSENEVILGADDKHLNFRISAFRSDAGYYLATLVHTNNWFGKIYLALVMPFHRIITQNSMKRILKNDV